ncbi:DUF4365 domain-containing protein [Altererythrobacter luteolus]|uniref:DUF4365 domain-containing protein n=1 Tax=Pontixanthobacter luteolus TaxID=295089 RepID=A0A6I4V034_9SPHN|nr:DUF4365 domain-containing protein [Pontixanthobacter luteolus]MXP46426.1 DUF4365 domain-containing protein [Pontixanthobacter luteolus]
MAHIQAVSGMAGTLLTAKPEYDYGVDGQFDSVIFREKRRVQSGLPLQFQAKASVNWEIKGGEVIYDLEGKTYNDLVSREPHETTLILILLCLPKNAVDWHLINSATTTLKTACYWDIITGTPLANENTTKRIKIPETQVFTPKALLELLKAEKLRRLGMVT